MAQRQRQQASRIRNRSAPYEYRYAYSYDPNINYSQKSTVTIGAMNKTRPKCSAKKCSDEPKGMFCAAGKVFLPDTEKPLQPIKNLLTGDHSLYITASNSHIVCHYHIDMFSLEFKRFVGEI